MRDSGLVPGCLMALLMWGALIWAVNTLLNVMGIM